MDYRPAIYYEQFRTHLQKSIPLKDHEFQYIVSFFTVARIKKKTYLQIPSQVCRHENYVVSGLFQSSIIDDTGKEHTLYFPHEDWWAGDFKSFRREQPSNMTILALEDCITLQISKRSFEKLLETSPAFERCFRNLSENAGIALQERIVENLSSTAEEKYQTFLRKYPALHSRLSQKRIASFLGVTPEYFSQMVSKKSFQKS